jgi:hypothetical protein
MMLTTDLKMPTSKLINTIKRFKALTMNIDLNIDEWTITLLVGLIQIMSTMCEFLKNNFKNYQLILTTQKPHMMLA